VDKPFYATDNLIIGRSAKKRKGEAVWSEVAVVFAVLVAHGCALRGQTYVRANFRRDKFPS